MSNTPENKSGMVEDVFVLFDGPSAHQSGRFIEVENRQGKGVRAGEWTPRGPYWLLGPFHDAASCAAKIEKMQEAVYFLRQKAAAAHDIPRRDLLDNVLAIILDAAEGKAPEGGRTSTVEER